MGLGVEKLWVDSLEDSTWLVHCAERGSSARDFGSILISDDFPQSKTL